MVQVIRVQATAAVAVPNMINVTQFNNFLPPLLFADLSEELKEPGWNYGWRSNKSLGFSHWNHEIVSASPENGLDKSSELTGNVAKAWQYIKTTYFPDARLTRCYMNAHTFGVEGYPHTDSNRPDDQTIVVYLNKHWQREWGGETMVYDGYDISHAQLPGFNKAIVFPGNAWHTARGVTRICPDLRVTLMFKICTDNFDLPRDVIQAELMRLGTDKMSHRSSTLCGHLLRVYDLLKNAGYPQQVCNAGAIHSIFGTNIYTHQTIAPVASDTLISTAGYSAVALAVLFSQLARPATLETSLASSSAITALTTVDGSEISVTQEQLNALYAIESANLLDQKSLSTYPNLQQWWIANSFL